MQTVLVHNTVIAFAKLTDPSGEPVNIDSAKLIITYPSETELVIKEVSSNYIYFHAINPNEVGYKFIPTVSGVYTFAWTVIGDTSTASKSISLLVQ